MNTDSTSGNLQNQSNEASEFGCWKWIFVGLILIVAAALGFLVLF